MLLSQFVAVFLVGIFTTMHVSGGKPFSCKEQGIKYATGDKIYDYVSPSECSIRTCEASGVWTTADACCKHNGIYYEPGATFPDTPCCNCECADGLFQVICACMSCEWPTCPDDAVPVTLEGDCCPSCP